MKKITSFIKDNLITLFILCLSIGFFLYIISPKTIKTPDTKQNIDEPTTSKKSNGMTYEEFEAFMKSQNPNYNDSITPTKQVIPSQAPNPTTDPNMVGYCYVDKNGSFQMTTKECMELQNTLGSEEFAKKAFYYCLDGKNPEIGDAGSKEDREAPCMEMFGMEKVNN